MKTIKRILALMLILCLSLAFTACKDEPDPEEVVKDFSEHGNFENYYSEAAYYVNDEDGNPKEIMYILCTDEALTEAVGKKNVIFNSDGTVKQYTVTIGVSTVERMVTYNTLNGSTYYSDIVFDENELPLKGSWDHTLVNSETGEVTRTVGVENYVNGVKSSSVEEIYSGDTLISKTTKEYSESGELIKETVE